MVDRNRKILQIRDGPGRGRKERKKREAGVQDKNIARRTKMHGEREKQIEGKSARGGYRENATAKHVYKK